MAIKLTMNYFRNELTINIRYTVPSKQRRLSIMYARASIEKSFYILNHGKEYKIDLINADDSKDLDYDYYAVAYRDGVNKSIGADSVREAESKANEAVDLVMAALNEK